MLMRILGIISSLLVLHASTLLDETQKWIPFINAPYCGDISQWKCVPCDSYSKGTINVTLIGDQNDVFGYSGVHIPSKTLIFGFRGTRNLKNWINNLIIAKPNAPFDSAPREAKIHLGFLLDYQKIQLELYKVFQNRTREYPEFMIRFVGHSLGGALALLASVDLISNASLAIEKTMIYTIGMPRVGNAIWANWTNSIFPKERFIRIVNQNDFTPHLPPDFSGFEHSGSEIWISNFTHTYSCVSSKLESDECSNSINFNWDITRHGEAWGQVVGHKSCYKNILFKQS